MRRRKFLMLLGGAVVACPLAARAQQASKRPTVAFFFFNASANATWSEIIGIHPPIGFLVVHRPPKILGGIRFHDAFPRATELLLPCENDRACRYVFVLGEAQTTYPTTGRHIERDTPIKRLLTGV
jgi:hypothetical protein